MFETGDTVIYTDGSKMESGTGAGIYSNNHSLGISIPLGNYASVYQAEIFAISDCMKVLEEKGIEGEVIHICTDSQSSLESLASHCFTSKIVIECLQNIESLSNKNEIYLTWVPGHEGIEGNEKADELARKGSQSEYHGPEPALGLPYKVQRTAIRNFFTKKHETSWNQLKTCKHTKQVIALPCKKTAKYLLGCPRNTLRDLVAFTTGHCKLNKHMNKLRLANTTICKRCNEEDETPLHLLTSCPTLVQKRYSTLGYQFSNPLLLSGIKIEQIHAFIKKTMEISEEESTP